MASDDFWDVVPLGSASAGAAGARWRLERVPHAESLGTAGPVLAAVYEGATVGGTRYRLLDAVDHDARPGAFWVIIHVNFVGSPAEEASFNEWYSSKHLREVSSNPGFHRAWRLETVGPPGDAPFKYWAVYEIDHPDDFANVRRRNTNPWDGLWPAHVAGFERSFHRLIP